MVLSKACTSGPASALHERRADPRSVSRDCCDVATQRVHGRSKRPFIAVGRALAATSLPCENVEVTRIRSWLLISALGIAACRSELKAEHERLARALARPASILCRVEHGESGGCNGDCLTRSFANNGVAFASASRLLKDLPRVHDPSTEADAAAVRERAAELARGFGPACQKAADEAGPVSVETQACAHVYETTWSARGQLLDALGTLRDAAKQRSGVELPDHRKCASP